MEFEAFSSTSTQALAECDTCGRKFNIDALSRHGPICAKTAAKARKVFDSSKQRAEGSDIPLQKGKGKTSSYRPPQKTVQTPKNNWRAKHEDFVNSIRSARMAQKAMATGGPLPPPPPPSINPDYIPCDYCGRRFNQQAAERHINFCKEQHERLPSNKQPSDAAKTRAAARTMYKAPRPKAKNGPASNLTSSPGFSKGRTATQKSKVSPNAGAGSDSGYGRTNTQERNYGNESSGAGRALRTGRNAETYSEARQLSAKQRANMPRKSPSAPEYLSNKYSSSRYGGYSTPSPPPSGRYGGRNHDGGYFTNSDSDSHRGSGGSSPNKRVGSGTARFCHECGTKYPVPHAKFCCECGIKRIVIQ